MEMAVGWDLTGVLSTGKILAWPSESLSLSHHALYHSLSLKSKKPKGLLPGAGSPCRTQMLKLHGTLPSFSLAEEEDTWAMLGKILGWHVE